MVFVVSIWDRNPWTSNLNKKFKNGFWVEKKLIWPNLAFGIKTITQLLKIMIKLFEKLLFEGLVDLFSP